MLSRRGICAGAICAPVSAQAARTSPRSERAKPAPGPANGQGMLVYAPGDIILTQGIGGLQLCWCRSDGSLGVMMNMGQAEAFVTLPAVIARVPLES